MIYFVYVWCVIVFLVMVPKYVIDVSIIWLNDNIYSRNTWFPTTDVQTQNIGKPRYANRRAPTECRHTVATQATEYQRWRDVSCRSRRCRPMPMLGQRRNASWDITGLGSQMTSSLDDYKVRYDFCSSCFPWFRVIFWVDGVVPNGFKLRDTWSFTYYHIYWHCVLYLCN